MRLPYRASKGIGLSTLEVQSRLNAKFTPNVRQEFNREILEILIEAVEKNPQLRFGQIMSMLRTVTHSRPMSQQTADQCDAHWRDEFYLESEVLLERMRRAVEGSKA